MKYKFLFVVQGEGRGHFTQAIAVAEALTEAGHEITAVLVGSGTNREIPDFVRKRISAPFIRFESPNFSTDINSRSIRLGKSIWNTLHRLRYYQKSMKQISETITSYAPDMVINFYEPIVGLSKKWHGWKTPLVAIAHQYVYLHPEFKFPVGAGMLEQLYIRLYTKLTALGANALLALSFYPFTQAYHKNITIAPPLLRGSIRAQESYEGNHYLIYLVNAGYIESVIDWHKKHPEIIMHCFTDSKMVRGSWQVSEGLTFHSLDDTRFLRYLSSAKGVMTTAGFETVCEAMYLAKPVLMVPVEGHFEQWCNARDGAKAGAGIYASAFDLNPLINLTDTAMEKRASFIQWADQAKEILFDFILSSFKKEKNTFSKIICLEVNKDQETANGIQSMV